MALLLASERPAVAAVALNPIVAVLRLVRRARARRLQRLALASLLEFDAALLDDLGIERQDVIHALHTSSSSPGADLAERRAAKANLWPGR